MPKENEKIKYIDFVSLYPTVQYYKEMLCGFPTKYIEPKECNESWFGFIKCKIIRPRRLFDPILLSKIKVDGYTNLIFVLCKKCAETQNQSICEHIENERVFIGTWTTTEVANAIEKGYRILKIYEVWNFKERSDGLFKTYIRRFMAMKLQSSKYDFVSKEEEASLKQHIKDSLNIDVGKFEYNPGLRSLSKIALNSNWGKFSQRPNFYQSKYVSELDEYYSIVLNDKVDKLNIQFINDDMCYLNSVLKDHFIDTQTNSNIWLAILVTAHARLMLYSKIETYNEKVLYFDTDFLIVIDNGTKEIETGPMLGQMTDELNGQSITSYVATGPKSYSFKYGPNQLEKSVIKGFTLNHQNGTLLNHDSLKKIVKEQLKCVKVINERKINRKKNEGIVNVRYEKAFKLCYNKRAIKKVSDNHISTVPFGYL